MTLWKFTLREVRNRPGRAILTLLSVVIGVAAVVSVTIAAATTRRAYKEMYEVMTGRAALEVLAEGGGTFDENVLSQVETVPGVSAAAPVLQRPSVLYLGERRIKLSLLAIDPERDKAVRDYELREGQFFVNGAGVLLEEDFAGTLGIKINDQIKLLTKRGPRKASVVGLLARKGASSIGQGGTVFLPLKAAQSLFKAKGRLNAIHVVLADEEDEEAVRSAIAERLPVGLDVRRPASRTQLAQETLYSSQEALKGATALSLIVSVFIILNTFLMNVGERRRQFSILRAIGATRRQVTRLLLAEGLAMGALGTLVGMIVGLGGAYALTRAMERVMGVGLPAVQVTWTPFALGPLFGIGVSLAGTFFPAWRAGRVSPLEGMSPVAREDKEGVRHSLTFAGLALLALSVLTLVGCFYGWASMKLAVASAILTLIGLVLLVPAALGPLSRLVSSLCLRWMRVEGDLAQRQIVRRRTRTWLTIGVLFVAISTGIGMASSVIDNVRDIKIWYERTLVGDFFVRAMMPDMATGTAFDMPEELGQEIAAIGGIENIDTARFVKAEAAGRQVVVIVREFTPEDRVNLDLEKGDAREVRRRLFDGEVVLSTVLAQRVGLAPGQEIEMETLKGPRKLKIAGTTNEYSLGGLTLYMQRNVAKELLGVEGVDAFIIKAEPAELGRVEVALRALCAKHGLLLQSFADVSRMIDGMIAGVVGCLWVILTLGFVVAAFGSVNTLTMNVLEQTRELGLLRIVAMTRWQVRKMIFGQAAIMGIVGLVPGALGGLAVAWVINMATLPDTGHPVEFVIRPLLIGGSLAAALAIVLAVAWLPAERAARLELIEALHYE